MMFEDIEDCTFSRLIDMALMDPEPGAVNFNILHAFLQSLVKLFGVKDIKLSDVSETAWSALGAGTVSRQVPPIARSDSETNLSKEAEQVKRTAEEEEIKILDEREEGPQKQDKEMLEKSKKESVKAFKKEKLSKESEELQYILEAEDDRKPVKQTNQIRPSLSDSTLRSAGTKSVVFKTPSYDIIKQTVSEKRFPGRKKEVISEIWNATKVSARLDACDTGIENLHSLLDQLMEEMENTPNEYSSMQKQLDELKPKLCILEEKMSFQEDNMSSLEEQVEKLKREKADKTETVVLEEKKVDRSEIAHLLSLPKDFYDKLMKQLYSLTTRIEDIEIFDVDALRAQVDKLTEDMDEIMMKLSKLEDIFRPRSEKEELGAGPKESEAGPEEIGAGPEEIGAGPEEIGAGPGGLRDLEDMSERLKRIQSEVDELAKTSSELVQNCAQKQKIITNMKDTIDEIEVEKADKNEMQKLLSGKASIAHLALKVDTAEFAQQMDDLNGHIAIIEDNLKAPKETFEKEVEKIYKELDKKLDREEIEKLMPLRNRIKALMLNVKKMKEIIQKVIYPEAAGITKCISCGRAAELAAGGEYYRSNEERKPLPVPSKCLQKGDTTDHEKLPDVTKSESVNEYFREHEEEKKILVGLPHGENSVQRNEKKYKALEKPVMKHYPISSSKESKRSTIPKLPLIVLEPVPSECLQKGDTTDQENLPDVTKSESDNEYFREHDEEKKILVDVPHGENWVQRDLKKHKALEKPVMKHYPISSSKESKRSTIPKLSPIVPVALPKNRSCGSTVILPQQKGTYYETYKLIEKPRMEECNLVGFDNVIYKGKMRIKRVDQLSDSEKDIDAIEALDPSYLDLPEPPTNLYKPPRYCGGQHTITHAQFKGLKFIKTSLPPDLERVEFPVTGLDGYTYQAATSGKETAGVSIEEVKVKSETQIEIQDNAESKHAVRTDIMKSSESAKSASKKTHTQILEMSSVSPSSESYSIDACNRIKMYENSIEIPADNITKRTPKAGSKHLYIHSWRDKYSEKKEKQ